MRFKVHSKTLALAVGLALTGASLVVSDLFTTSLTPRQLTVDVVLLATLGLSTAVLTRSGLHPPRRDDPEPVLGMERQTAERVATRLHDTAMQSLVVAAYLARTPHCTPEHREVLAEQLMVAEQEVRDVILDCRTPDFTTLTLADAFVHLDHLVNLREGLSIAWQWIVPAQDAVSADVAVATYRFAHEMLFNIAQHSGASEAIVIVEVEHGHLHVQVVDDGSGFDPKTAIRPDGGLGQAVHRASLVGAQVQVKSAPGRGMVASLRAPLARSGAVMLGVWPGTPLSPVSPAALLRPRPISA